MAGIDSIGGIGGGGDLDEFKKIQNTRVTEAQTQLTQSQQPSPDAGAEKSVGQAQGGQTNQQYPQL